MLIELTIPLAILALTDKDDQEFIKGIYLDYRKLMYKRAYGILRSHDDTEDAINIAIENLIKKIDTIREMKKFTLSSYVNSTITNVSLTLLNKRGKQSYSELDDGFLDASVSTSENFASVLVDVIAVRDALEKMKPRERTVLQLRYYDDLTDEEIGAIMNIGVNSVRPCLMRARRSLTQLLKEAQVYEQ